MSDTLSPLGGALGVFPQNLPPGALQAILSQPQAPSQAAGGDPTSDQQAQLAQIGLTMPAAMANVGATAASPAAPAPVQAAPMTNFDTPPPATPAPPPAALQAPTEASASPAQWAAATAQAQPAAEKAAWDQAVRTGVTQPPPQATPAPAAAASTSPPSAGADDSNAAPAADLADQGSYPSGDPKAVRGARNNNPLNVRYVDGQPWTKGNSDGFGQYPTMTAGIAAATRQLVLNQDAGYNTITKQVTRWVGDPKADLTSYIGDISKALGVDPNAPIDVKDPKVAAAFIAAAAPHESGPTSTQPGIQGLNPSDLERGVMVGLSGAPVGGSGGSPSAPQAPTTGATAATPAVPQNESLFDLLKSGKLEGLLPYSKAETAGSPNSRLLALASGLLQGRTFGQGLGIGLQRMNENDMQDIANKRAANAQTLQLANVGLMDQIRNQQLGLHALTVGQGQERIDQNAPLKEAQTAAIPQRLKITQQNADQSGARVLIAGDAEKNRYDPATQGAIAGARGGAAATSKENASDIDGMLTDGANAATKSQELAQLKSLVTSGQAGTGPGLAAVKRQIANYFGVNIGDTNPDSAGLASTIASQVRGSGIMGKNMRTQREFDTVMAGLASADQRPAVLTDVVNRLQNLTDLQANARNEWLKLDPAEQTRLRGNQDAFQNWYAKQLDQWQSKVQQGGGLYAHPDASAPASAQPQTAPQAAQSAPRGAGTTSTGVKFTLIPTQ